MLACRPSLLMENVSLSNIRSFGYSKSFTVDMV